jgi:hypothetical protein
MPARDDEQALLAAFSELYDWLASQGEHASADVASRLHVFATRVQEQTTLKPLPQFMRRQAHLIARGGGQRAMVDLRNARLC